MNFSCVPAGMPAPHWLEPLPALWQTSVPPAVTVQPWLFSRLVAELMLNGYGLVAALEGRYGLFG